MTDGPAIAGRDRIPASGIAMAVYPGRGADKRIIEHISSGKNALHPVYSGRAHCAVDAGKIVT